MIKFKSLDELNLSRGKAFVLEAEEYINVGQEIEIDDKIYVIKEIILPTRPTEKDIVLVIV